MIALSGIASTRRMDDRQGRARDSRPASARLRRPRHDEEPAIDLLPPVHPRGILLADEAALGEADAVQLGGIAFEPEDVAELGAALGDAEAKAMLEPAARRLRRRRQPARAELGQARVGRALAVRRPVHGQRVVALDRGSGGAGDRSSAA